MPVYFVGKNLQQIVVVLAIILLQIPNGVAGEKMHFVAAMNTVDTVISEVVLREAYRRLDIEIDIQKFPGDRPLTMANKGQVDGDIQRINGLTKVYPNLIQIFPAINFIEGAVFAKNTEFVPKGWSSLEPYRIGIIRGIKFAENNTTGMKTFKANDYSDLFMMLDKERIDIAISPRLNGLYQVTQLGVEGIRELLPSIQKFELFHYIHKKHVDLIPKIAAVLVSMKNSGELEQIRERVIKVLISRAAKKLPVCDDDYQCFESASNDGQ